MTISLQLHQAVVAEVRLQLHDGAGRRVVLADKHRVRHSRAGRWHGRRAGRRGAAARPRAGAELWARRVIRARVYQLALGLGFGLGLLLFDDLDVLDDPTGLGPEAAAELVGVEGPGNGHLVLLVLHLLDHELALLCVHTFNLLA